MKKTLIALSLIAVAIHSLAAPEDTSSGQEPLSTTVYHGNVNTKKFHKKSCRYFDCEACTRVFYSREEAIQAGYIPCKVCKP